MSELQLFNTLTRQKERFEPINPPNVGLYVCGPTVYGDPHLGHARSAISFDIVFRYLKFCHHKVRYVRNITDVGHLVNDADQGEDKIARMAKIQQLEPMEVAQYYTDRYHLMMDKLCVLRPSIEPRASGHIIEQINLVQAILDAGYAYETNGSVYFDVPKYNQTHAYGILSGRVLDDLMSNTRENLEAQDEKQHPADFALWKKANPEHIMRWPSPWGEGFPGWHLECTAMGSKYLGKHFDIHGGGMDLLFPHHESEIAQGCVAHGQSPAKYWMHNNMITLNGKKMGKSLGNSISLEQFFTGEHPLLIKPYDPMTIRFFILQAHYRSTLDFSNEALVSSEKGLRRIQDAYKTLGTLTPNLESKKVDVQALRENCYDAMNDDFNTPMVIATLFECVRIINAAKDQSETLSQTQIDGLKTLFSDFFITVMGMQNQATENQSQLLDNLINMIINLRADAKTRKDYESSDRIRDTLCEMGITVKDGKDGSTFTIQ